MLFAQYKCDMENRKASNSKCYSGLVDGRSTTPHILTSQKEYEYRIGLFPGKVKYLLFIF